MKDLTPTPENPIDLARLERLRNLVGSGPVMILTHDSPDPDALAAGKALATLLNVSWSVPSRLFYSGLVARAENRAMLRLLTPEWESVEVAPDAQGFSAIALVDTQPGVGNNSLADNYRPQIVFDHHRELRRRSRRIPYSDLRSEIGATSSLLYQHLEAAGIIPDSTLATAMFYGIQTDTRGLARGASPVDGVVYLNLVALLDRQKLVQVEQAGLSRQYFQAFYRGLQATHLYPHSVVAILSGMDRPDLPADLADTLIRLEDCQAALCMGVHHGTLYLSLRTIPEGKDAGPLAQQAVGNLGKAGGHGSLAGGQVSLAGRDLHAVTQAIEGRFLRAMGESEPGEPLLPDEAAT